MSIFQETLFIFRHLSYSFRNFTLPNSLTNLNSFFSKPVSMEKQLHLKDKIKEQYGKIALDGNSIIVLVVCRLATTAVSHLRFSFLHLNHQKLLDTILTH
jgi:hypothetical protein